MGLAACDVGHVEKFKKFIGLDNKVSFRPSSNSYRYTFKDEIFKNILISKGCVPKKSLILTFPTPEQVPLEYIRHFIRGYFDGDGCFCNTDSCFEASFIGTEDFIKGCLAVLPDNLRKDLKIKTVGRKDGAKKYGFYSYYDVLNFLNYIYADSTIYLDRKYNHYKEFIEHGSKYHKSGK